MGRDSGHPALRHGAQPPADAGPGVRALPAGDPLVHGGLLHELFPAHRAASLHAPSGPVPGLQPHADHRRDRPAAPVLPLHPAAARPGRHAHARTPVAACRAFLRRQRHPLPVRSGRKRGHPDDGELVQDRNGPAAARTQPHGGRTAEPQEPAEPAFPVQYAQQHLLAHTDRHLAGPAGGPRPEPDASLRALRQQPPGRAPERRDRLPARLHRTDAHPPAAPRPALCLAARRAVADTRGAAAVHLARGKRLQTRREQRKAVVHHHRHPRDRRPAGLQDQEQLLPEGRIGPQRLGNRTSEPGQTAPDDLSGTPYLRIRTLGRGRLSGPAVHQT